MSKYKSIKPVAAILSAGFLLALVATPIASAQDNPFAISDRSDGNMLAAEVESKCGAGKCGEGKCGGDDKGAHEHSDADQVKEGKCGAGKCGEGKCGGDDKGMHVNPKM